MTLNDFDCLRVVGRGAFGEVRLVRYKKTHELFAMKIMKKSILSDREQVCFECPELESVRPPESRMREIS